MRPVTSIVLVGIYNNLDPKEKMFRQHFIGTFIIYLRPKQNVYALGLVHARSGTEKGSANDHYVPIFKLNEVGQYIMFFPDYLENDGLELVLSNRDKEFTFETGFDPSSIASSKGSVINGELLVEALDEFFKLPNRQQY